MANPLVALSVQGAQPVSAYAQGQQVSNQNRLSQLRMAGAEQTLNANQQKMQQQNRLQELVPAAMSGDQGALQEVSRIDYDLFSKLDERQRIQLRDMNEKAGRLLAWVQGQPPEMRAKAYQLARQKAVDLGYPADQLPDRYDPLKIDSMVAEQREMADLLGVGGENAFGKDLKIAIDPDTGERVYVQASGRGGVRRVEGVMPPGPEQDAERARMIAEAEQSTPKGQAELTRLEADAEAEQQKIAKGRQIKGTALKRVNELLEDPESLAEVSGLIQGRLPARTTKQQDLINKFTQLKSILTADNLGIMSGVLSESDMKVISDIAGGGLHRVGGEQTLVKELQSLQQSLSSEIGGETESAADQPPVEGAKKAPDGNWYVEKNGQWFRVDN